MFDLAYIIDYIISDRQVLAESWKVNIDIGCSDQCMDGIRSSC